MDFWPKGHTQQRFRLAPSCNESRCFAWSRGPNADRVEVHPNSIRAGTSDLAGGLRLSSTLLNIGFGRGHERGIDALDRGFDQVRFRQPTRMLLIVTQLQAW